MAKQSNSQKTTHDQEMTTIAGLPVRKIQADLDPPFEQLGDYKILRCLGKGGMGEVYLAQDVRLDRLVAVKVLPSELSSNQQFLGRFMNEARSAAKLVHPHIVPIYRIGDDQGYHFFAMQFIEGQSLDDLLQKEPLLKEDQALEIIEQIASGLTQAHSGGMIHRDIKPANIMLDQNSGKAMLADFGMVKSSQSMMEATAVGVILGTVQYISPEQGRGQKVDGRSDLYSLGATLFRTLTGQLPFSADNPSEMIYQHIHHQPQSIASINSDVSPQTVAIVERLLQKDPDHRYQDAQALVEDIQAVRTGNSNSLSSAAMSKGTPAVAQKPFGVLVPAIAALSAILLSLFAWNLFSGNDKSATKASTAKTENASSTDAEISTPSPEPLSPRLTLDSQSPFETRDSHESGGRIHGRDGMLEYLPVLQLDKDTQGQGWHFDGKKLILKTPSPSHRLALPMRLGKGYDTDFLFATTNGAFNVALPVGRQGGRALLRIGFNDGKGIELLGLNTEKKFDQDVGPDSDPLLQLNRGENNRLQVAVTFDDKQKVHLRVIVNGATVIERKRDAADFSYTASGAQHVGGPVIMLIGNSGEQVEISSLKVNYHGKYSRLMGPLNSDRDDKQGQRGLAFDSTLSSRIVSARDFDFSGEHPLTVEAWLIPEEQPEGFVVCLCNNTWCGMLNLKVSKVGKWQVHGRDYKKKMSSNFLSQQRVQWNKRTHFAMVLVDGQVEFFLDGVKDRAEKLEEGLQPKGRSFRIGGNFFALSDNKFFKGKIEQFRISKTRLYTEKFSPQKNLSAEEETMVLYDFRGGWGNICPDLSGNGIVGIVQDLR